MYNINFTTLLNKPCNNSDLKTYFLMPNFKNICYRGHFLMYKKKKSTSKCYINDDIFFENNQKPCICSKSDFTCKYGFIRNYKNKCVPDPDHKTTNQICNIDNFGKLIPSNYENINFDLCKIDYKIQNEVCMFNSEQDIIIFYTKDTLYLITKSKSKNYDYKNFTLKLDKEISNLNVDFNKNCLYAIINQKYYQYCWKYDKYFKITNFTKLNFVKNFVVESYFDYIIRNLFVLETNGRIKVYNFDKKISKYISPINIFINKFKFDLNFEILLYQIQNSNQLFKLNFIDGYTFKNFKINCADEFSIDFLSNSILVFCKKLSNLKLYDFYGNFIKTINSNSFIQNNIISFEKINNNIFAINSTSLIIIDINKNTIIKTLTKNNNKLPIKKLIYLSSKIKCKLFFLILFS